MAATQISDAKLSPVKRARLVCFRCHSKKIKCNLLPAGVEGGPCRNCTQAGALCELRPSRRAVAAAAGTRQMLSNTWSNATSHSPIDTTTTVQVANTANQPNHITALPYPANISPSTSPLHDNLTDQNETSRQPRTSASIASVLHQGSTHSRIISPHSNQVQTTPSAQSLSSQPVATQASYFSDTGYMQILSQHNPVDEDQVPSGQLPADHANADTISPALQGGFLDTYFEYCFVWCPVLDEDCLQSEVIESLLLRQALALCANRINPPLSQCRESLVYYNRAKELFYSNCEGNALVRLASIMLFFWWSVGASNRVNMDNAWWWTGIAIRIAQESGLHRESPPHHLVQPGETTGLRRRIWWTLFARDRILSISQGRPTIIDPDYCDVKMVTPQDFPDPTNPKVEIFINWVKLLEISGRLGKQLSKRAEDRTGTANFSQDLISWVQSLPETLLLTIHTVRTTAFDRDVHRLYLTYLTNITLLHMSKSSQLLPRASNAAIIAASCMARLFEDYLVRGSIRFLSGDAGWEIAVALLALLHARRIEDLRLYAEADIRTLCIALKQMALLWPSSRLFYSAFDKLLGPDQASIDLVHNPTVGVEEGDEDAEMVDPNDGTTNWMDYFPFVTAQTSPLIDSILTRNMVLPFSGLDWPMDINVTLQDFLSLPEFLLPNDASFDIFNL